MKFTNTKLNSYESDETVYVIDIQNLKIGDIVLSTTDSLISTGIRLITRSDMSHAAIYLGDGFIIEAVSGGVRRINARASSYLDESHLRILRPRGLCVEELNKIVKTAREIVGRPYSVLGAIGSVLPLVRHRNDPGRFCSQIVAEAYASVDPSILSPKLDESIVPGDFLKCQFLDDVTNQNCYRKVRLGSLNHALSEIQPYNSMKSDVKKNNRNTITPEEFEKELLSACSQTMKEFAVFNTPYHLMDILRQMRISDKEDPKAAIALNKTMESIARYTTVNNHFVEPKATLPGLIEEEARDGELRVFYEGGHPEDLKELNQLLKDIDFGRNADLAEWESLKSETEKLSRELNYSTITQLHFWILRDYAKMKNTYAWLPEELDI